MQPGVPTQSRSLDPPTSATLVGAAIVVALTLVIYGAPVPRLSEELYLPLVRHTGNAAYLARDWTSRGPFSEHWVFDHSFGWLAAAIPLVLFGWIGRLVAWSVLAWLLVRLGLRLGASVAVATVGICLWLVANQSLVGGDWMLGTFEAKTVGYCFLVAALLRAVDRRVASAIVFLGVAVSMHPGVGVWAGLGLSITLLALPETRRAALWWSPVGALLAAPGIVTALAATDFRSARLLEFLVTEAVPQHADPFFGGARLAGLQIILHLVVLVAMFGANWWWARRETTGGGAWSFAHRLLLGVQMVTMLAVLSAFVARVAHWWSFLLLSPMRVGPLIVPLIFFVNVSREIRSVYARDRRRSWTLAIVTVVLATFVTSPLIAAPRMFARTVEAWVNTDHELEAFHWIRDHTPPSTRCLVPIDRQDAFMNAERPIVVNWQALRYDDIAGWHRRVVQLVGGDHYFRDNHATGRLPGHRGGDLVALRRAYNALGQRDVEAIARRYHATCVVATTGYQLPVWHRIGQVRIYRLNRN